MAKAQQSDNTIPSKLKSRKFIFALVWTALVLIGFIVTIVTNKDLSYMGQLITISGTITTAYMAGQSFIDHKVAKK